MFVSNLRMAAIMTGVTLALGSLTGCVNVGTDTSHQPTAQVTLPVDTSKSLQEQVNEVITGYCKVRDTPAASAVAETAKQVMNQLIAEAQKQGVQIKKFDPGDPKMCQGK